MRQAFRHIAMLAGCLLAGPLAAHAQSGKDAGPADEGAAAYREHCATCHGADGRGDGPRAGALRFAPPNLRRLAERNKGRYPADEVRRIIDGRKPVKGHGGAEMPAWGDVFKTRAAGYSEEQVKARINSLVRYLETLQD
jgi:mono/diheme cytochrome c family protein